MYKQQLNQFATTSLRLPFNPDTQFQYYLTVFNLDVLNYAYAATTEKDGRKGTREELSTCLPPCA